MTRKKRKSRIHLWASEKSQAFTKAVKNLPLSDELNTNNTVFRLGLQEHELENV